MKQFGKMYLNLFFPCMEVKSSPGSDEIRRISSTAAYHSDDDTCWTPPDHSINILSSSASSIGHQSSVLRGKLGKADKFSSAYTERIILLMENIHRLHSLTPERWEGAYANTLLSSCRKKVVNQMTQECGFQQSFVSNI